VGRHGFRGRQVNHGEKQIGAQQVRQRASVGGVGLNPDRSDRARPKRMREVQLIARLLEQTASHSQP
jgi:hypothetical protein